jgi:hypothetical protein
MPTGMANGEEAPMNIEDIPSIPDREKRFEEITVDCYDE